MKLVKYFSMFSGVGGFELGIQQATNNEWECVGFSEIDKYASMVLKNRFKGVKNYGDATKIKTDELPDFDFLCGGFPCQPFSIAGKRRGFEDTRGTLFFEIARVIKAKRPKVILLENVKGLLNHEKGKTFKVILQTLSELGYDVQWMVLNSKFFGVPQNRERVFIIGSIRGTSRPEVLPFRENAEEISELHYDTGDSKPSIGQAVRRYGINGVSPPLNNWSPVIKLHRANEIRESNDSPTLTKNMGTGGNNVPMVASDTYSLRKLTPRETERLQGFPDDWTLVPLLNGKMMSDTQRYKMMGNAVTVNVIKAIVGKLNVEVIEVS